jgi:sec-independent protein translocase protein TatA
MGGLSWMHWAIILVVALVLFGGKGKVSDLMGDVAKGIKSFKKGLSEDGEAVADTAKTLETQAGEISKKASEKAKT